MNVKSIIAALFIMVAGVQTVWAQKVTLYMSNNQTIECDIERLDSIVFSEKPAAEIVVTVDANGNADSGHWFEKIDEANFYIDDIKYTAQYGDLIVTGYNMDFFKGAATIMSKLIYRGRIMNVVEISGEAFKNCKVLTSVNIPNSITRIGSSAFSGCSSLTSITIGKGLTSIDSWAFNNCTSLEKVIIPNITAWCSISFSTMISHSYNGYEVVESLSDSSNPLFYSHHLYCDENTEITKLVIPDGVTNISSGAFINCNSLTSISIPNSVTSIGKYAFYGTSWFDNQPDGLVYAGKVVYIYKGEIPEGTDIVIKEGTLGITSQAFYRCSGLISVSIPNSVTSIGYEVFDGCSNLSSVAIGNGVKNIGEHAFFGCTGLTNVYCLATTPPNGYHYDGYYYRHAFDRSHIAEHTTLHVPANSVDAYKATEPWSSFKSIVAIE
ncbi:MAG: leucine-rich repeat domain-containing protein [Bacteroidaceae bacterium]|nr:leucine-rich repeat domain-containing protein [Bacteroidaceae bacterium]